MMAHKDPVRISDVIDIWANRFPEKAALVEAGGTWSYNELASRIVKTEGWLRDMGVRSGDRVVIVCENCRALVAILFALVRMDAWPVLVNARLAPREVDQIIAHCGARLTIYCTNQSTHARQHAKRHGAMIEEAAGLGPLGIGQLNSGVEPEPVEASVMDRIAALIYTSGTTGSPKGVMLTHRNLLFVAAASAKIRSLSSDDRLFGVLPISHAVGLSVVLLGTLLSGATLYLAARFDPIAALASFEKDSLTVVLGAPSMFSLLLEYMELKRLKPITLPALRTISSSGAPLQPALKASAEAAFGLVLHNGYGVTECSPNIAQTRLEHPRSDVSVGQILPGVEIQLVETNGDRVRQGEVGELWVRGPNVMKGYYRAPLETAAAINASGWFNTRDMARMEEDHLFIVGRTTELIVRFGLNVFPAEVEAVLNSFPGVIRSAVVGRAIDGAAGGEEVIAYVQTTPGSSLRTMDLAEHAAQYLASYKRPSQILFLTEMPLTLTGKVVKAELAR